MSIKHNYSLHTYGTHHVDLFSKYMWCLFKYCEYSKYMYMLKTRNIKAQIFFHEKQYIKFER